MSKVERKIFVFHLFLSRISGPLFTISDIDGQSLNFRTQTNKKQKRFLSAIYFKVL